MYIGDGIVEILQELEDRYDIDFNQLEEKRFEKKLAELTKMKEKIDSGQVINIEPGVYLVGVDLPVGDYYISGCDKEYSTSVTVTNTHGNAEYFFLQAGECKRIRLKDGYFLKTGDSFALSIMKKSDLSE